MPSEPTKPTAMVPLTKIEIARLLTWATHIEASEQFATDDIHLAIVAKLAGENIRYEQKARRKP